MAGAEGLVARIGLIMAAAGPPVVALSLWRPVVTAHPVLSAVAFIAYEAMLAVVRFSGQIASDLRERWRHPIVDHLDMALRRRVSRFGARYRDVMLTVLKSIDQKGLETVGFYTPQLDEVFVDVSLAFQAPHKIPTGLLANPFVAATDRRAIRDFLDHATASVLSVIGAPGSGKTTLLRHTARDICRNHRGRRRTVPILLYLRDHAHTISRNMNVRLSELAAAALQQASGLNEPNGWFEQQLRKGNCVVLLDGLDEVASQQHRKLVADWLERQISRFSRNDFVITSRPQGYLSAPISGATVLSVLAFTEEKVTSFVKNWYIAVELHAKDAADDDARLRAESGAADLLDRLDRAAGLYELTINPLLLTMVVNVHRYRGVLPGSRAKLYREICHVMLGLRQEAKRIAIDMDGDRKEALLRGLAYNMMCRRVSNLPRAEVIAELKPGLRRMSRGLAVEDFLADVASNGLLVERESGVYSFAHLTFQEYLAAMYISGRETATRVLVDAVGDSWWRETTLLYTAQSDADQIVRACLESATVPALALAFDCTEQDIELDLELRSRLDAMLDSVFDPITPTDLRRLMAGVLATRHLRTAVRAGAIARVSSAPITTGIYWLFQQDVPGHDPDGPGVATPSMDRPITGVRGADAVELVRWINDITAGYITYRLPTREEMNSEPVRHALAKASSSGTQLSVWLAPSDGSGWPALWTEHMRSHPHRVDWATIVEHVGKDLQRTSSLFSRLLLVHSIVANRLLYAVLERTLGLAKSVHTMRIPQILDAIAMARAQPEDFTATLVRSADLDSRLTEIAFADYTVDVGEALALTRIVDLDLTDRYGIDSSPELSDRVDFDAACANIERIQDHRPLSLGMMDWTLALNTVSSLELGHLFDAMSQSATSYAEGLSFESFVGLSHSVGNAMAYALVQSVNSRYEAASTLPNRFCEGFIEYIGDLRGDGHYVVPPDNLAGRISEACDALVHIARRANDLWAQRVAANVKDRGIYVATREGRGDSETISAVRIAALCLAAQAKVLEAGKLVADFRSIAAGITLLERRWTGRSAPSETVMLATS